MPYRLRDNLDSRYFEAANRLSSKKARRRIVAYVESYDDIFFWRSILGQVETDKAYFEIMLPTRERRLERGKKAVLMSLLADKVGSDMIACVDADYDYLVQGATETSRKVCSSPYVFHTYAYAIENLQCWAPALHDVAVAVTLNDHPVFDMEEYLRQFSQAVYPLFVWNIWYYRSPNYNQFTMTDMLRVIETGKFSMEHAAAIIDNLRQKVGRRVALLRRRNPGAGAGLQAVEADIRRLGVTPDTTYLYIQGHHLFDKVVVPMLQKVCDKLIRRRSSEISRESMHGTQRRNELSCYNHSIGDIPLTLRKGTGYLRSDIVERIKADISNFLSRTGASGSPAR